MIDDIDVSLLLLRRFLCGVVCGVVRQKVKKSRFLVKNLKSHFFKHTPTSLYETLSLSLLFWSKNSLFRVFCLKLFFGGLKKNSKNRKRGEFFCSRTLSLSLSLLQHHHFHHHHHHNQNALTNNTEKERE